MTEILFTHANTKREISIHKELVFAIQYSAAHHCTHLISNGGGVVPVAESVETARGRIYGNNHPSQSMEDKKDGT